VKDLALYFAVIAVCTMVFLPIHVTAIRATRAARLVTTLGASMLVSAAAGAVLCGWLLAGEFSTPSARLVGCAGGALTFVGFAGVYGLVGPISVDRSVSSHIVSLIWLAPQHRMKEAELFALYTHDDMLAKRFHDCIETGIVVRQDGELTVTPRGARIAIAFVTLGSLLGMRMWHLDRHFGRTPFGRS